MSQGSTQSRYKLKRCEQLLKSHSKANERSVLSRISLPRHVGCLRGSEKIGNLETPCCGSKELLKFYYIDDHPGDESDAEPFADRANSLPTFSEEKVMGSLEAQIEFLRHELFLTKNQVQERNKQVEKLESLIQHHYEKMKHNCEGSDNLVKVIELLHEAVELQNNQIKDLTDLKRKIFELEEEPHAHRCREKSLKGKPAVERRSCHESQRTAYAKTNPSNTDRTLEMELEKQKSINCQLNENTRRLEEEVRSLRAKIEIIEAEKSSSLNHMKSFESEKQNLLKQINILKEHNKKLISNISKLDADRDRMVKELDQSDETTAKLKTEAENLTKQLKVFEAQYRSSSERNGKLQELLTNSERIVETLNKQKMQISKELGETHGKFLELQKSYESLKCKYQQTSRHLKKVKRDFVKVNEEKALLQSQLQEYVSKVRQIEDLLLQKEQEREFLFEQFRELNARDCSKTPLIDSNNGMDDGSPLEEEGSISGSIPELNKADVIIQTDFDSELPVHVQEELSSSSRVAQELQRELTLEKKTSDKLHTVIKSSRREAMEATTKNEVLTKQLEMMANNVHHLESQVKTIGQSLENYRKECMDQEAHCQRLERELVRERYHRARSESSHSTML